MSPWYWVLYTFFTVANVALFWWTQRTAWWCRRVMREVAQRLAIAWNRGYIHGAQGDEDANPYIDGPAMRASRQDGGA